MKVEVMEAEITHIYISEGHNYFGRYGMTSESYQIVEKQSVALVARRGIEGDRFFDFKEDYKGQITFFSESTVEAVKNDLGHSEATALLFRRNVVLSGVDAEDLIGKRFRIGELEFTGSCEAAPCFWMDEAVGDGTHEFLKGRGGLRARIIKGGSLALGKHTLDIIGEVPLDLSKEKKD